MVKGLLLIMALIMADGFVKKDMTLIPSYGNLIHITWNVITDRNMGRG